MARLFKTVAWQTLLPPPLLTAVWSCCRDKFTAFNAKEATDIPANSILDIVDADNHTTTIEKAFAGSAVYDIVVLKISADGTLTGSSISLPTMQAL